MVLGQYTKYALKTLGGLVICGGLTMSLGYGAGAPWGDLYFQGIAVVAGGAVTCCLPSFIVGCCPEDSEETRRMEERTRTIMQMIADEKAFRTVLLEETRTSNVTGPELPNIDICGWFTPLNGVPCICPLGHWLEDPEHEFQFRDVTDEDITAEGDRLRTEAERLHNRRAQRRRRTRRPVTPYQHALCSLCNDSGKAVVPRDWEPCAPNAAASASTSAEDSPMGAILVGSTHPTVLPLDDPLALHQIIVRDRRRRLSAPPALS